MSQDQKMQAAVCLAYGDANQVKVMTVDRPRPKTKELLIRVVASSLNTGDMRIRGLIADPFTKLMLRLVMGFFRPRQPILGAVLSGVIVETGAGVTQFKVGDSIFGLTGFRFGGHAQYAILNENAAIAKKPRTATHDEAAALPFGGNAALYFLKKAGLKSEDRLLIYGASGSVGTSAIQIAKVFGAQVTAVCSARNKALVMDLGADYHIDYQTSPLETLNEKFDIIFDANDKTSRKAMSHLLAPMGKFISVSGYGVAKETRQDMEFLAASFDQGKLKAVIDRRFPLEDISSAHAYVEGRTKAGNVVIQIEKANQTNS